MNRDLLTDLSRRCEAADTRGRPKYLRLINAFQDAVADGTLASGDRLPTETELSAVLPFALGTVQKALNGLVAQGVLYRSRRNGTFVAERARPLNDTTQYSFERPDGTGVTDILTRVVECSVGREDGRWGQVLGPCNPGYVRLVRIDDVDGAFRCCNEIHLRADKYSGLFDVELDRLSGLNIRTMLTRLFGVETQSLAFATRAAGFPVRAAKALGCAPSSPCLELEVTGYGKAGAAQFLQSLFVPPNEYRIRLHR